jgi:hypothetical protein
MSDRPPAEIEIVEDPNDLHKVNRQSFIDEQEWHLYKCIETEIREFTTEYEYPCVKRCALNVRCRAARRPAYFFWNIFLITVYRRLDLVSKYWGFRIMHIYMSTIFSFALNYFGNRAV